jgi:DNA-binding NarL/FixJ family response regulator
VKRKRNGEPKPGQKTPRLHAPPGLSAARLKLDAEYLVLSYPLPTPALPHSLSQAEREVAILLVRGLSSRAVAARRGVALRTISNQIASLYAKLGVGSRIEFVRAVCGRSPETQA